MGIALHNRATTITALNAQVDTANNTIKNVSDTANANAAAAAFFKAQAAASAAALSAKNETDVKLATDLANLQNEVSHAKPTVCLPSAIIAMVDGLRHLQTGSGAGQQNSAPAAGHPGGAVKAAPTTPSAADQLIAKWIGDLFQHDSTCADNLHQISNLQGATP